MGKEEDDSRSSSDLSRNSEISDEGEIYLSTEAVKQVCPKLKKKINFGAFNINNFIYLLSL